MYEADANTKKVLTALENECFRLRRKEIEDAWGRFRSAPLDRWKDLAIRYVKCLARASRHAAPPEAKQLPVFESVVFTWHY